MSYRNMTIARALELIRSEHLLLPHIQRKYVWDTERIERLFDSLMRGYPIGTFLFWNLEPQQREEGVFYRFMDEIDESRIRPNPLAVIKDDSPLTQTFGVLDGQQRLTSLLVGLTGTYIAKRRYARTTSTDAFHPLRLHFNILSTVFDAEDVDESERDDKQHFQLRFLSVDQAATRRTDEFWVAVPDLLPLSTHGRCRAEIERLSAVALEMTDQLATIGARNLERLRKRLWEDNHVSFFDLTAPSVLQMSEIFVRINSAGRPLSRTDLMFSTIVARWPEGRAEVDELIERLNRKGRGMRFDSDFVMRSCLVLTDLEVLFKTQTFSQDNIDLIRQRWDSITDALERAVDFMISIGFSEETLSSHSVIIPLAYFIHHNGDLEASRAGLRQFVLRSLLKNVWQSKTDHALRDIRRHFRQHLRSSSVLRTADFIGLALPEDRSLEVTLADITRMLDARRQTAFPVLAAAYGDDRVDLAQARVASLHPDGQFTRAKLRHLQLSPETEERILDLHLRVPNLYLSIDDAHEQRTGETLAQLIERLGPEAAERFRARHFISADARLSLVRFEEFAEMRRTMLGVALCRFFEVSDGTAGTTVVNATASDSNRPSSVLE